MFESGDYIDISPTTDDNIDKETDDPPVGNIVEENDQVLIIQCREDAKYMLRKLLEAFEIGGLHVNMNKIEYLVVGVKRILRSIWAEQPPVRTPEELWDRVLDVWEEMAKNLDLFHNLWTPCRAERGQLLTQYYKGIKIHISKVHPEQYRESLILVQSSTNDTNKHVELSPNISQNNTGASSNQTCPNTNKNNGNCIYKKEMNKWLDILKLDDLTDKAFEENVENFLKFLADALDLLPGPKNPISKYYEARKGGRLKNNNCQYSTSSNPQRSSKNDRKRRKAKFDYELIQYEYFYQRRKAVRKIISNDKSQTLKLRKDVVEDFFKNKFETSNPHVRMFYEASNNEDLVQNITFSQDLILSVIKSIAVNTSLGPDRVLAKAIRDPIAAHVIAEIANKMLQTGILTSDTDPLTLLCFADDIVIVGKDKEAASILVTNAILLLQEIGLNINTEKSSAIIINNGKLQQDQISTVVGHINSIGVDEEIKYLVILNQFICPTLIYPFQTASVDLIPKKFLIKADNMIKSVVKEMLQLPGDTPNSMIYTSTKYKGLSVMCTTWKADLQQLNINTKLENLNDQHVNGVRDYETIRTRCLSELQVSRIEATGSVKQLRHHLRHREFKTWCAYPQKGKGVVLFEEVPAANSWIIKHEGLSSFEWREMLKMIVMVAPVHSLPGRSTGTTHCRHCSDYETLPHVLGSCPQGEVLRIKRHNIIRSLIADALRSKNLDVHEEVHCIADGGSNRRIDIIAINRNKQTAEIIDPTIRFEISATQPSEVDEEKKKIYEPTIQYLSAKYDIEKITVTGHFFGARGLCKDFPRLLNRSQTPVVWNEKVTVIEEFKSKLQCQLGNQQQIMFVNFLKDFPRLLNRSQTPVVWNEKVTVIEEFKSKLQCQLGNKQQIMFVNFLKDFPRLLNRSQTQVVWNEKAKLDLEHEKLAKLQLDLQRERRRAEELEAAVEKERQLGNEAVLGRVGEERIILIRKTKRNWLEHWLRRNCLLKDALEGMVNGRKVRSERSDDRWH
ncbi:hypothetical protein ANN_18768 [Periplaneta americana]|uniref:Reverse transcriptase domain-containing protein n=1 Tax=Periplaneta americana TaxID=6978 RepID=A0ABQ8SQZ5_PERAM|nr:hypothetical protein ANN_18768 [Periplaneta americana]